MPHADKQLEEKVDYEKARKENISKLVIQFGEDKREYITGLYDTYFSLIQASTRINHHLIPGFIYKETRADLVNEFGKPKNRK